MFEDVVQPFVQRLSNSSTNSKTSRSLAMTGDFRESVSALMVGGHYIWPQDEKFWRDLTTSSRDRWGTSLATRSGRHMTNDPCWKNAETSWSGDANDWSKWSEDLRHKKATGWLSPAAIIWLWLKRSIALNLIQTRPIFLLYNKRKLIITQLSNRSINQILRC